MSDEADPRARTPVVSMGEVLLRADPTRDVHAVLPTTLEFAPRDAIEARL
jgi:hypothetical protein